MEIHSHYHEMALCCVSAGLKQAALVRVRADAFECDEKLCWALPDKDQLCIPLKLLRDSGTAEAWLLKTNGLHGE